MSIFYMTVVSILLSFSKLYLRAKLFSKQKKKNEESHQILTKDKRLIYIQHNKAKDTKIQPHKKRAFPFNPRNFYITRQKKTKLTSKITSLQACVLSPLLLNFSKQIRLHKGHLTAFLHGSRKKSFKGHIKPARKKTTHTLNNFLLPAPQI